MLNRIFLMLPVLICVFAQSAVSQERIVPETKAQVQFSYAPLVKKVAPAVVNIFTKREVETGFVHPFMNDPFFGQMFRGDMFGNMQKQVENSLGSGVIVEENGLVVTNAHVIRGAQEIRVVLQDQREYEVDVILDDEASDLALLRLKTEEKGESFPYVTLRASESLEVGDLVIAIGNPFGVGQTVTSGIVSAQGRSSLDVNDYNFFIQTDAAINPGNSGGPLVAMDGSVVGINTAIFSKSGGSIGIGFAIPSEMVVSVIAAAKAGQKGVVRPWMGVDAQDLTPDIAHSLGMARPHGALISALHPASPLLEAGLKVGDVIVKIDGHDIRDGAESKFRMAMVPIGGKVGVTFLRAGEEMNVDVDAIAPPEIPPRDEMIITDKNILQGVQLANINPALAIEMSLNSGAQGVVITAIDPRAQANRFLAVGDIIMVVNDQEIKASKDVEKALAKGGRGIKLVFSRMGRVNRLFIQ